MSKLADGLHTLVTRLKGGTAVELHHLEDVVTGLEEHLAPVIKRSVDTAVAEALAEVRALVEEGRAAEQRLLTEVKRDLAKLAGATTPVETAPEAQKLVEGA